MSILDFKDLQFIAEISFTHEICACCGDMVRIETIENVEGICEVCESF